MLEQFSQLTFLKHLSGSNLITLLFLPALITLHKLSILQLLLVEHVRPIHPLSVLEDYNIADG